MILNYCLTEWVLWNSAIKLKSLVVEKQHKALMERGQKIDEIHWTYYIFIFYLPEGNLNKTQQAINIVFTALCSGSSLVWSSFSTHFSSYSIDRSEKIVNYDLFLAILQFTDLIYRMRSWYKYCHIRGSARAVFSSGVLRPLRMAETMLAVTAFLILPCLQNPKDRWNEAEPGGCSPASGGRRREDIS